MTMTDDVLGARGRCDGCGVRLEVDSDHDELACIDEADAAYQERCEEETVARWFRR